MIIETIRGLFINTTILTSFIMFANMIMHEKYLSRSVQNNVRNGILSGIFGCLLMMFSVPITSEVILDFRYIPVIMMAIYVSSFAAFEASLIIAIFRLAYFGINRASITAFVVIIILGIVCGAIGRTKLDIRQKWILSAGFSVASAGFSIYSLIVELENRGTIMLIFLAGLISVSVLMYYLNEFLTRYNQKMEEIKDDAEKDYLTGLKNQRQFDKLLKRYTDANSSGEVVLSLLYIDIDHFKEINDRYGHVKGDIVLRDLGKLFRGLARSQDIISRRGGEEFAMLLADCQLPQAAAVAERIRSAVENTEFRISNQQSIHITVSIGVAAFVGTDLQETKLLEQADKALYRAKQSGRNKVILMNGEF